MESQYFCLSVFLIPGIGVVRNGSQSWIPLGFMNFQPAELAKIAVLGVLASSLANEKKSKMKMYFQSAVLLLLPIGFIMVQPDFGSAFVLVVAVFFFIVCSRSSIQVLSLDRFEWNCSLCVY